MIHLPVTYKDLAKFLLPFDNTIYNFTYILTLNSSDKKTKTIIELIIRNNDIYLWHKLRNKLSLNPVLIRFWRS